jgi:hypothetical protein
MSYSTADARHQVLDDLARAAEQLGRAVSRLGEAYEQLDEQTADRLEELLFRPLQAAYGLAKRTHAQFAARYDISAQAPEEPSMPLPAAPGESIALAGEDIRAADEAIAALQDSMLPVEVGDTELRAGLSRSRELIGPLPMRAHELVRTLGR